MRHTGQTFVISDKCRCLSEIIILSCIEWSTVFRETLKAKKLTCWLLSYPDLLDIQAFEMGC